MSSDTESALPPFIPVNQLPVVEEMPDPLTMYDGTLVTTEAQRRARRREMIKILEDYEYGHMPPLPGNVSGEVTVPVFRVTAGGVQTDYRMIHLTFGANASLEIDLGLFTPATSPADGGAYPTLIVLTYGSARASPKSSTKTPIGSVLFSKSFSTS